MRLYADQGGVVQAMISAFEFQDLVASSSGAGEANAVHGGFGAAVAEADHFHGKAVADFFRQLPFHVVGHAEHGAGSQAGADSFPHCGMAKSGNTRPDAKV